MNRNEIIAFAIAYAERLLGMGYSRTYRYRFYPSGSADCSSYMYGCWLAAGFPLLRGGKEQVTSCYEVYADGFELMFPDVSAMIGKKGYWAPKGFYKTFPWERGDIIFYNFNTKSTRANKITHVAMCYDKDRIIHTANTREDACIKPMSYGDGHILAVIRLREGAEEMPRPMLQKGSKDKVAVRRMQALLNVEIGARLNCDGIFGSGTLAALRDFQHNARKYGGSAEVDICGPLTWAALIGDGQGQEQGKGQEQGADERPRFSRALGYTYEKGVTDYMRGEDVRALQALLTAAGYVCGKHDGIFGKKTLFALRELQRMRGMEVTGVAEKAEVEALGGVWGG